MQSIDVPGAEDEWIVVPDGLQNASDRKVAKWAAAAARSVLPARLFGQDPDQLPVQVSLAAAAAITERNERAYVLRSALPEQFLPVRLRWVAMGQDRWATLLELATPQLKRASLLAPEAWLSPSGTEGLRTTITRDHTEHGYVAAFPLEDLAVQVKVDVDSRSAATVQEPVRKLLRGIRRLG